MAGRILNAATRADIAACHLTAVKHATDRAGLIAIWRAAKLSVGPGKHLDEITAACTKRTAEISKAGGK